MQGKIIKGIAGFYYVNVVESGIFECKAKGAFRKDGIKPLVGDDAAIEVVFPFKSDFNSLIFSSSFALVKITGYPHPV